MIHVSEINKAAQAVYMAELTCWACNKVSFCRWQFRTYFLVWKLFYFDSIYGCPSLQMSSRDLTTWLVTRVIALLMAARGPLILAWISNCIHRKVSWIPVNCAMLDCYTVLTWWLQDCQCCMRHGCQRADVSSSMIGGSKYRLGDSSSTLNYG